jgi:hypothetical protein
MRIGRFTHEWRGNYSRLRAAYAKRLSLHVRVERLRTWRGVAVWHDHFVGQHGGAVVLEVGSEEERVRLDDPGPLDDWRIATHPLTFSLTAVGFAAQISFTLGSYRGVSLDDLAAAEIDDPAIGGGGTHDCSCP